MAGRMTLVAVLCFVLLKDVSSQASPCPPCPPSSALLRVAIPTPPAANGLPVQAAAAPPPNAVDCAFRELAVRVAARNLQGDAAKLALVSAGLNASACPHGARWAADCARSPDDGGGSSPSTATIGSRSVFVSPTGSDTAAGTQAAPLRTLKAAQAKVAEAFVAVVQRLATALRR